MQVGTMTPARPAGGAAPSAAAGPTGRLSTNGGFGPLPVLVGNQRVRGPRRIVLTGLVLILLTAAVAAIAAVATARRVADLDTMLGRTDSLASASANLYASLSQADASATTAFLSGGLESSADRQAYDNAVAAAAGALATAASGAGTPADQQALGTLAGQLPVYTGLVDTARAYNRLGLPVGAAYLREASALMRTGLLPAAQTLNDSKTAAVTRVQVDDGTIPWLSVAAGLLAVIALALGMVVLSRSTRRRLNLGIGLAVLGTIGWLAWLILSGISSAHSLSDSRDNGSVPLDNLVQARIFAQQARADETLYLIARGSGGVNEKSYQDHTKALTGLLTGLTPPDARTGVQDAVGYLNSWIAIHTQLTTKSDSGDYPTAVKLGTQDSAAAFAQLDQALQRGIGNARSTFRSNAEAADSSLSGLAPGIAGLAVLAMIAIAAGLWPRVREYQ